MLVSYISISKKKNIFFIQLVLTHRDLLEKKRSGRANRPLLGNTRFLFLELSWEVMESHNAVHISCLAWFAKKTIISCAFEKLQITVLLCISRKFSLFAGIMWTANIQKMFLPTVKQKPPALKRFIYLSFSGGKLYFLQTLLCIFLH